MLKNILLIVVSAGCLILPAVSSALSFTNSPGQVQPGEFIREMKDVRQKLIRWVNYAERENLELFPDSELVDSSPEYKKTIYSRYRNLIKKYPLVTSQKNCFQNEWSNTDTVALAANKQNICLNLVKIIDQLRPENYKNVFLNQVALEYASLLSLSVTTKKTFSDNTANAIQKLIQETYDGSSEFDIHYFDDLEWHNNNLIRLLSSEKVDVSQLETLIKYLAIEAKNIQLKERISIGQAGITTFRRAVLQTSRLRLLNWEQSLCERRNGHGCRFYMNEAYGYDPVTKKPNTLVSMLRFATILEQARPYEQNLINTNTLLSRSASVNGMKQSCLSITSIIAKIIDEGRGQIQN